MIKTKTLLLSKITKIDKEEIYKISKLPYTKSILLYITDKELDLKLPTKVSIVICKNLVDLNKKINEIFQSHLDHQIFPAFSGDANSKYAIKTYNKTFGTNVDSRIFKEKDIMGDFLGELTKKKYIKSSYKDLIKKGFEEISDTVGTDFIIKPTNAHSSTSTFRVNSSEEFERTKLKLTKTYDYIIEEYIGGDLFSVDFFFDGDKMFLLVLVREIAMIELSDKDKFSIKFKEKYGEELNKHFNFILPLTYHIDLNSLSSVELSFLDKIKSKLQEIGYRGIIHLEYKYDKASSKIGFIEWGARYGGYRKIFMKEIYHTDPHRLQYNLLVEKDLSKFVKVKGDIYKFKEKEHNLNFVRVKTSFIDKTNYIDILEKSSDVFKRSFDGFLNEYYKSRFGIIIKKIDFFVSYNKEYNFLPFYKNNETKLDYILELDDENFKLFKKKKFKVIEDVFFHDYN